MSALVYHVVCTDLHDLSVWLGRRVGLIVVQHVGKKSHVVVRHIELLQPLRQLFCLLGILRHQQIMHTTSHASRKALRRGVTHSDFDIEVQSSTVSTALCFPTLPNLDIAYIISSLPTLPAQCPYGLRKRQHYNQLPQVEYKQYKNSFCTRQLYIML